MHRATWKMFTEAPAFLILLTVSVADCQAIPKIEECGLACSQVWGPGLYFEPVGNLEMGLRTQNNALPCKRKASNDFFNHFCREKPATLSPSILESMKISTAMRCTDEKRCSLHLSVKGTLHLHEKIRGVELCSLTLDTADTQCVSIRLSKNESTKSGQKVQVQFNCFEVSISQPVYVTMKTIPYYCGVKLEDHYFTPDCRNEDMAKSIPVCIAGNLNYKLDRERKAISINVTDFLEDQDYNVRLCHKWFSCQDIGAHALIKGDNSLKSTTLKYSELLPCLCIEGWSALPDSRRRQICPFKNDTDILWNGVVYDPVTQSVAWESVCPVQATLNLCQKREFSDQCLNLQNSSKTAPQKVEYSQVDAHPRLCIKFTTQQGSWLRCPFAYGQFAGWQINLAAEAAQLQIIFASPTNATFSVILRNKTQSPGEEPLHKYPSINVDNSYSVKINISRQFCGTDICIQAWRTDVQYSISVETCDIPCIQLPPDYMDGDGNYLLIVTMVAVSLILVTTVGVIGYMTLAVHHREQVEHKCSLKSTVQHLSPGSASSLEQRVSILYAKEDDDE